MSDSLIQFWLILWAFSIGALATWSVCHYYVQAYKKNSAWMGVFGGSIMLIAFLVISSPPSQPTRSESIIDTKIYKTSLIRCLELIDMNDSYQRDFCEEQAKIIATKTTPKTERAE